LRNSDVEIWIAADSMNTYSFTTVSHEETVRAGKLLGKVLAAGCVIGLTGDLGAGKTCFVKGLAGGLNNVAEKDVTSPTFTILQVYDGRLPLYHFDAYRLTGVEDLANIGFDDYIDGKGVSVVEWVENIMEALPEERLVIDIRLKPGDKRVFDCTAVGTRHETVLDKFKAVVEA